MANRHERRKQEAVGRKSQADKDGLSADVKMSMIAARLKSFEAALVESNRSVVSMFQRIDSSLIVHAKMLGDLSLGVVGAHTSKKPWNPSDVSGPMAQYLPYHHDESGRIDMFAYFKEIQLVLAYLDFFVVLKEELAKDSKSLETEKKAVEEELSSFDMVYDGGDHGAVNEASP